MSPVTTKKRIVVTGCEGYIGRVVCEYLTSQGHDVVGIDLQGTDKSWASRKGNINEVIVPYGEYDALVHLAALTSVDEGESLPRDYIDNNVFSYTQFLKNHENQFPLIVYASSAAVYDDEMRVGPSTVYGHTKLHGEYISDQYAHTVSLRFANPVGVVPHLHEDLTWRMMNSYPSLYWALARAIVTKTKFGLHDIEGMNRDFFPLQWIPAVIEGVIMSPPNQDNQTIFKPIDLCSGFQTDVKSLVHTLSDRYGFEYGLVTPPAGTSMGGTTKSTLFLKSFLTNFETSRDEGELRKYLITALDGYIQCVRHYRGEYQE